jgi:pimeloyl-ACP methyl ester carboxylesterase
MNKFLALALAGAFAFAQPAEAKEVRAAICGLGDAFFCGPLSVVAKDAGASTHYWWTWGHTAEAIAAQKPKSVVLITHSQGCKSGLYIADALRAKKIKVRRFVCFDGVPGMPRIPSNVTLAASWRKPLLPGGGVLCRGEKNCREVTYRWGTVSHMGVPLVARSAALSFIRSK